jgi:c-di-GMP-binding flagellar brake protein YcgR
LPSLEKKPARVSNISEGGIMIYLPEKLHMGQQLRAKVFFPAESNLTAIEVIGEVVWIDICLEEGNEYRCGLKFIEVAPDDLKRLKNFLHNLAKI